MSGIKILGVSVRAIVEVAVVVFLCMLILGAGRKAYDFGYAIFAELTVDEEPGRDIEVTVTDDMSNRQIAQMLEDKGLIRDANVFYIRLMLTDYKNLLTPGTYTLNTSMKSEDMMYVLSGEAEEDEEE